MDDMKMAIKRLVCLGNMAGRYASVDDEFNLGGTFSVFFDEICETIYVLVGEHTDRYDESVTSKVMNRMCNDGVQAQVDALYAEYEKQHRQPEPKTMDPVTFRKMAGKNGGYYSTKVKGEYVPIEELDDAVNCMASALQVIGEIRGEMNRCRQQIDRIISGESQEDDEK